MCVPTQVRVVKVAGSAVDNGYEKNKQGKS